MGASTCALGSQRCRPYRGIFTRNAIIHANHRKSFDHEFIMFWAHSWVIVKFRVPDRFWI